MSLSPSSCDNLNQMLRVKEVGHGAMVVAMCACMCANVSMLACVCQCMHGLEEIKSRMKKGKEGKGLAMPGVNSWGLRLEEGGARVINLLFFVLSVCFHEALDGTKVKAVSLKIVWLLYSMFSPQG